MANIPDEVLEKVREALQYAKEHLPYDIDGGLAYDALALLSEPQPAASQPESTKSDWVCLRCDQPLRYNVPRLGPNGGFVHTATGKLECQPEATAAEPVAPAPAGGGVPEGMRLVGWREYQEKCRPLESLVGRALLPGERLSGQHEDDPEA